MAGSRKAISTLIDLAPKGIKLWVRETAEELNRKFRFIDPVAHMGVFFGSLPDGWLECDGSEVSRETYSALFDAIGTTYGEGDGATTFNLPNRRGFVVQNDSETLKLDTAEITTEFIAIRAE